MILIKTVTIVVADDVVKPMGRKKVGECSFYEDYSFKIKSDREDIKSQLTAAIKRARQKESLMLRSESMEGDTLVMSGEFLKPGDKNYIYALIVESARLLNEGSRQEFFSLEP